MRNTFFILVTILLFSCASNDTVPKSPTTEFVKQILEPTGGELLKPKDWFYSERHVAANSLNWVISKEDPDDGYETGLSIQFLLGIKDGTGLTPEQFVQVNLEQILNKSVLINQCGTSEVGQFMRTCIEVSQVQMRKGVSVNYRVLYSMLWNNERDSVAVTVAGTPAAEWHEYAPIFDKMTAIKLVDFNRIK